MPTAHVVRVLHLVGSAVSEDLADLSRLYARDCLEAVGRGSAPRRYRHLLAYVSPDGRWRFPVGLGDDEIAAATSMSQAEAEAHILGLAVDVAVPQMFCRPGMTVYRTLLEQLGIPVVGNSGDVMALGADKARARAVVAAAGGAVPEGEVLCAGESPTLAPPVVVKPVDADNSDGVSLVRKAGEYPAALAAALAHADRVLVERYVELGREVRCGVLERAGGLIFLPLEEYAVDPVAKPVRDRADKLRRGSAGDLQLVAKDAEHAWILYPGDPGDPADPMMDAVWALAACAHRALGCRDYSLFDVRVDPDGRPWFLEAGLYCSFARSSVLTVMARAAGIELGDMFATAVAQAISRGPAHAGRAQVRDTSSSSPQALKARV